MSTTTVDHPRGASVLAPAAQVTMTAALSAFFAVAPTDQGRDVLGALSAWLTGLLASSAAHPLLGLVLGSVAVLGLVVAIVLGVVRERLWAVAYTLEEVVAVAFLLGIYGWVLANSPLLFLVVVAAQGAAMTTRYRGD